MPEDRSSIYPTTRWTDIIDVIQQGGDDESLAALGALFEQYRPAIRAFFARFNEAQADDLASVFFQTRVIQPWNRRHGALSPLYEPEDIRRLNALALSFQNRARPLIQFLWAGCSERTRQSLENWNNEQKASEDFRANLLADLNSVITGPSIYEENRFADVELSVESKNLMRRQLTGNWVAWLNRSLLADAFPGQLTKGIGFLYMVERQEQRKFRTFLAHTLWWFLKDTTKAQLAESAGAGKIGTSLDELAEVGLEVPDTNKETFGRQLDEEFARQLLACAGQRFQHSKLLEACLRGEISQKQAAQELGLSENAFRQGYLRFRRRLADAVREEVGRLVGPNDRDIQVEMNYLMNLITG